MAVLKYFRRIEPSADEQIECVLSKANSALSQLMPSLMMTITIMFIRGCHSYSWVVFLMRLHKTSRSFVQAVLE